MVETPSGVAVAVWTRRVGARRELWAARRDGETWGEAQRLQDVGAADDEIPVDVATGPGGDAMLVWHQVDGARRVVRALRFE